MAVFGKHLNLAGYILLGAAAGIVAGALKAFLFAVGTGYNWRQVGLHYSRLGIGGWLVGAAGGVVFAMLARRRRQRRKAANRCVDCGYDLTGNVSGRCPECGRPL